jgi:hypothetical protein
VSTNPFDDADAVSAATPVDPSATTASNPFDVFEVPADGSHSYAATSMHSSHPDPQVTDHVLKELKELNVNMVRALDALTFLTSRAISSSPPTFFQPADLQLLSSYLHMGFFTQNLVLAPNLH